MSCICPYEWHRVFRSLHISAAHCAWTVRWQNSLVNWNSELVFVNCKTTESAVVTRKLTSNLALLGHLILSVSAVWFLFVVRFTDLLYRLCHDSYNLMLSLLFSSYFLFLVFYFILQRPICHTFSFISISILPGFFSSFFLPPCVFPF